jgi:hypothetical protein
VRKRQSVSQGGRLSILQLAAEDFVASVALSLFHDEVTKPIITRSANALQSQYRRDNSRSYNLSEAVRTGHGFICSHVPQAYCNVRRNRNYE